VAARSESHRFRPAVGKHFHQTFSDDDGFAAATKFAGCSDAGSFNLSKTLHALDFAATTKQCTN